MGLRSALVLAVFGFPGVLSLAQENKVKAPESKYGFELRVRKAGEDAFDEKTQKYGIEAFLDPNSNKLVYICQTGAIAVVAPPNEPLPSGKSKDPKWEHAMELRVRKAGEPDWTKDTKKYGLEVFRDGNTGNLIYITETGSIAVVPGGAESHGEPKRPEWKHAMELRARKAGEKEFTGSTRAFSIEVFSDENNGNIVFISQVGAVAVLPGVSSHGDKKKPEWKHAMELRVRKGGDPDFNEKTPKLGLEVFQDANTGKLIYLSETGYLSVPAAVKPSATDKSPNWKYGLDLRVRKAGEAEFTGTTKRYGIEVFLDENNGSLIYMSEIGSVSDLPK